LKQNGSSHDNAAEQVRLIINKLDGRRKEIEKYSSLTAEAAIGTRTDWMREDPRVTDICLASKSTSSEVKFRAGLSRCSLADDFLEWEEKKYRTTRVSSLVGDLRATDNGAGHIIEYLNEKEYLKDKNITRKGIENGIKYRVFEELYSPGVSMFLFFVFHVFRDLRYSHLPFLAEAIHKSEWLSDLAEKKSEWRVCCQILYKSEFTCVPFAPHHSNTSSDRCQNWLSCRKRALEEPISNNRSFKSRRSENASHATFDVITDHDASHPVPTDDHINSGINTADENTHSLETLPDFNFQPYDPAIEATIGNFQIYDPSLDTIQQRPTDPDLHTSNVLPGLHTADIQHYDPTLEALIGNPALCGSLPGAAEPQFSGLSTEELVHAA
jgi:hypothetical protein